MRTCRTCGEEKPEADYYRYKSGLLRGSCKMCCNAASRAHYRDNPDYYVKYSKKWRNANRMTANATSRRSRENRRKAIHERRLLEQGGCCAICSRHQADAMAMHLDHDHRTGTIRALLCKNCNYLLGHAGDDEQMLLRAVEYLRLHRADPRLPKQQRYAKAAWWRA